MCVCLLNPLCIILPLYLVYALAARLFSLNSFGLTHLNFLCFYLFISCAIVLLLFLHLLKRRLFCFTIPYTRNAAKCCRNNSSNKASDIIWQLVSKYELVSASRSPLKPAQTTYSYLNQLWPFMPSLICAKRCVALTFITPERVAHFTTLRYALLLLLLHALPDFRLVFLCFVKAFLATSLRSSYAPYL